MHGGKMASPCFNNKSNIEEEEEESQSEYSNCQNHG
jgi:hypothetical protein